MSIFQTKKDEAISLYFISTYTEYPNYIKFKTHLNHHVIGRTIVKEMKKGWVISK